MPMAPEYAGGGPASWSDYGMSGPSSNFMKGSAASSGLSSIFGGLFGNNDPYKDAMKQYQQYANQAAGYQNPFYNAGNAAIPQYQNYLQKMSDPSQFINNLMGGYQSSPHSQYLQDQAMKAALNAGSASGLSGSSAMNQAISQNAADISSQDMNQWLQNVLGINTQYGQGLGNMLNMGQGAANNLSNIYTGLGNEMAQGKYGSANAKNQQMGDIFGGLGNLAMLAFL